MLPEYAIVILLNKVSSNILSNLTDKQLSRLETLLESSENREELTYDIEAKIIEWAHKDIKQDGKSSSGEIDLEVE